MAIFFFSLSLEKIKPEIEVPKIRLSEFESFTPSDYPLKITNVLPPEITASAAAVIDLTSGVPLYQKSVNRRLKPASITKLMTALVSLDQYKLTDILTVNNLQLTPGEAKMGLKNGDSLTVENLLYGLLLPSGNDAAFVLAENRPDFINLMNLRAAKLNMSHTHFANPDGTDEPNHYTTVSDLAILARAALNNKLIARIVITNWTVVYDVSGLKRYPLQNVNQLLTNYWGTIGLKTGYTQEANQCLIAVVKRGDRTLISIVLGSTDRFGESIALLNWGFENFKLTAEKDLRE